MKQAWMLTAVAVLAAATTASTWAQRASLPATTSAPVCEIGVPIPLQSTPFHSPRPLPLSKTSTSPLPVPGPLLTPRTTSAPCPAPGQAASQLPAAQSRQASSLKAALPAAAVLDQPVANTCCAQPRCDGPLCLLQRRLTTRFRHLLNGCPGCCCWQCDPSSVAESVASRIRAEEASAPSRLCAVRYLGTVDCHYYPEAEVALIATLRCDRNRCVRQEAAGALGNCCYGTPRVIEALTRVVAASEDDGHPCETCDDVRRVAYQSLQRLLAGHAAARSDHDRSDATEGLAAATARARATMAQVAGTVWVPCAYRCPPPQRNLADMMAGAGRGRHAPLGHGALASSAGVGHAAAGNIAGATDERTGARYFQTRLAGDAALKGNSRRPTCLFNRHGENTRPGLDLPARAASSAGTASPSLGSAPRPSQVRGAAVQDKPPPTTGGQLADPSDTEVLPMLIPVSARTSASAVRPSPRTLLPPGLTPLGRVPDIEE